MNGKAVSGLMLALLMIGMLTLAFNIQLAKSEPGMIIVPDDYSTIQEAINVANPGDTVFVENGTYYENVVVNKTLWLTGEDEETTFIDGNRTGAVVKIEGNNVAVKGFTIQNGDTGISAMGNYHGHNISYNIVTNNTKGIYHVVSSNSILSGNNITDNDYGVWFSRSSNNTLSENLMNNNKYNFYVGGEELGHFLHSIDDSNLVNGKHVYYLVNKTGLVINPATHPQVGYFGFINCSNSTVDDLTLLGNEQGLLLAYTNNSRISGNNIANNHIGVWFFSSSNNTLSENNITNNDSGIELSKSSNNILSENNITNNNKGGLGLSSSSNNILFGNNITDNHSGIELSESSNNIISENNIANSLYGIDFFESNYNIISENNITNNTDGIWLDSSSNNTLSGNNITNNTIGINLEYSSSNSISENHITCNNYAGISLYDSSNNSVSGSNITKNEVGIEMVAFASNNKFSHNNFVDNTKQVDVLISGYANSWDDGYPSGGNYWSDYDGVDEYSGPYQSKTGSDDIGDIPYVIDADNQDNYPLMAPYFPPQLYTLTILGSPSEVIFVVDTVSCTTPWSETYGESTSVGLVMPETYTGYVWSQWLEDGDPNRTKTVTMDKDITLTGAFTLDTIPPIISILSPENKTYPISVHFPLTFHVSELTSWIGYSLDGQMNVTVSGNTTLVSLSDGVHTITVYANDIVGNVGYSDVVWFTIQPPVKDTIPPTVSILSPENITYVTTEIPLIFTVDESVLWMAYSIDNKANMSITGNITLSELSEGSHYVRLYANDTAGNTGASEMVYFNIEVAQLEPFPTWIVMITVITVGVGVALLVYFTKVKKTTEKVK